MVTTALRYLDIFHSAVLCNTFHVFILLCCLIHYMFSLLCVVHFIHSVHFMSSFTKLSPGADSHHSACQGSAPSDVSKPSVCCSAHPNSFTLVFNVLSKKRERLVVPQNTLARKHNAILKAHTPQMTNPLNLCKSAYTHFLLTFPLV